MAAYSAEGRPDPFWSDPAEEGPRMARIYAAIGGTGTDVIPGRDFGYAGLAAHGRNPNNVLMIVAKSANDNAVIYEYVTDAKGPRVIAYWLSIEPSSRAEHVAKGNPSLITGLNPAEELGYGVNTEPVADGRGGTRYLVNLTAEPLRARRMDLMLEPDGTPFLGGIVDGKKARALYGYVQLRRGLTALTALGDKAIEEIRFYGTNLTPGAASFGQTVSEFVRP